ncbi:MAG TPA: hypothetical protein VK123_04860 [Candidatus Limnocylindrales bacterium]|nr:hypothetical protein [Candidatus Limnocylindrales bacterium]
MKRFGLATHRMARTALALVLLAFGAIPAWAQTGDVSVTTHETTSTSTWTSDWRIWALGGAVVLLILILALSRGRGGSNTTVVK